MDARIYQPAKPATQSGRFKTRLWVVEPEPHSRPVARPADRLDRLGRHRPAGPAAVPDPRGGDRLLREAA